MTWGHVPLASVKKRFHGQHGKRHGVRDRTSWFLPRNISPHPDRVFSDSARGGVSPHVIYQTAGSIFDPKTAFDSPGNELLECSAEFYTKSQWRHRPDQMLDFWLSVIAGFAGQGSRSKLRQSRWNDMNSIWDTSRYPPKHLMTSCQVKITRRHEFKKVKMEILGLVGAIDFKAIFS